MRDSKVLVRPYYLFSSFFFVARVTYVITSSVESRDKINALLREFNRFQNNIEDEDALFLTRTAPRLRTVIVVEQEVQGEILLMKVG